jgi:glycerophosphoryl diester phosphodiesterase
VNIPATGTKRQIPFTVFGHRGAPGFPRYGENTIKSFMNAFASGAGGLEFDVRRCADGTLVVIHDETIDRTTNGRGRVRDLTYEQLKKIEVGFGEPIPRLADVLDRFGGRCLLNLELKEKGLATDVKALLMERGIEGDVLVSAFDRDDNDAGSTSSWEDLRELEPKIPIALLATRSKLSRLGSREFIDLALQLEATAIHPEKRAVIGKLLTLAHDAGLRVHVWTVNEHDEIAHFRKIGVDGIFSDFPERCKGVIDGSL